MATVLAIGAVVMELVMFFRPAHHVWAVVAGTTIFAIVASVIGIGRISRRVGEKGRPGRSLLKDEDKVALKQLSFTTILMLFGFLLVAVLVSVDVYGVFSVTMDDDTLSIDSPIRDWDIAYSDIESCELKDGTFEVHRVFGLGTGTISTGSLHNDEIGDCAGAFYEGVDSFVLIRTNYESYYVFNDASVDGTKALYEELMTHLSQ